MLEYKGYTGKVELSNDSETFQGVVIEIKEVIKFEGRNPEELKQAFRDSIETYLNSCEKNGKQPDAPGHESEGKPEEEFEPNYEY
ncbi:MAG: hypothetical protein ACM3S2_10990 [Ignavibacteriales bacterium]